MNWAAYSQSKDYGVTGKRTYRDHDATHSALKDDKCSWLNTTTRQQKTQIDLFSVIHFKVDW